LISNVKKKLFSVVVSVCPTYILQSISTIFNSCNTNYNYDTWNLSSGANTWNSNHSIKYNPYKTCNTFNKVLTLSTIYITTECQCVVPLHMQTKNHSTAVHHWLHYLC